MREHQQTSSAFPPSVPLERFVEAEAAADFLGYSVRTTKQLARDGRIPAHPFGDQRKRYYFLLSELAEFLRKRVNSPHEGADRDGKERIQ